jgi:hypothetical protein
MEPRKAARIAVLCAGLVVIGVLLPWYSISFDLGKLGAEAGITGGTSQSLNGTEGEFRGGFVLVLALVAGVAAAMLASGRGEGLPISPRGLALVVIAGFALGLIVTLTDLFRDLPSVSGGLVSAGRGFGIYLTALAAAAGAGFAFVGLRGGARSSAS